MVELTAFSGDPNGPQNSDPNSPYGGKYRYFLLRLLLTYLVFQGYCYHGCTYLALGVSVHSDVQNSGSVPALASCFDVAD